MVLALQFLLENHTTDVRAFVTQPVFLPQIGAIELGVMRELTRAADAIVERLFRPVLALAAVLLQEAMAAVRQRRGTVTARPAPRTA